jgi:hypothetical protein
MAILVKTLTRLNIRVSGIDETTFVYVPSEATP